MRIVVAVHGTRGDVEPCAAVARELRNRGHEVKIAVPPNLIGFVESVETYLKYAEAIGLTATAA